MGNINTLLKKKTSRRFDVIHQMCPKLESRNSQWWK